MRSAPGLALPPAHPIQVKSSGSRLARCTSFPFTDFGTHQEKVRAVGTSGEVKCRRTPNSSHRCTPRMWGNTCLTSCHTWLYRRGGVYSSRQDMRMSGLMRAFVTRADNSQPTRDRLPRRACLYVGSSHTNDIRSRRRLTRLDQSSMDESRNGFWASRAIAESHFR